MEFVEFTQFIELIEYTETRGDQDTRSSNDKDQMTNDRK